MGIKKRSMFGPKFKTTRPNRWNKGQKMLNADAQPLEKIAKPIVEPILEEEVQKPTEQIKNEDETIEQVAPKVNLSKLRKAELIAMANELGIEKVSSKMTKHTLIKEIKKVYNLQNNP